MRETGREGWNSALGIYHLPFNSHILRLSTRTPLQLNASPQLSWEPLTITSSHYQLLWGWCTAWMYVLVFKDKSEVKLAVACVKWNHQTHPNFMVVAKKQERVCVLLLSLYSCPKKSPSEMLPPLGLHVLTHMAFSILPNSISSFLHLQ